MKALTIPASRTSMRDIVRSMSAIVSNLRTRIQEQWCLTVAVIATVALFVSLGLMNVPAIIVSGLVSLTAVSIAPASDQEGGES